MKIFSLLLFFCITTLGFAQTETTKTPQIVFKLGLGKTVTNNEIKIQFEEVLEDSRCPKDVQCVWAGQAKVKLSVSGPNMPNETLELILGKKDKDVLCIVDGYVFKVLNLAPYPETSNSEEKKYVLSILKMKV